MTGALAVESRSRTDPGLELPILLQILFGIDFLPRTGDDGTLFLSEDRAVSINEGETGESPIAAEESYKDTGFTGECDEITEEVANELEFNVEHPESSVGKRGRMKGKRIKDAIVRIKSKVQTVSEKRKEKRRNSQVDDIQLPLSGSCLHSESPASFKGVALTAAVPNFEVAWGRMQQFELEHLKFELSSIHMETQSLITCAQEIGFRVEQAQSEIAELENRLAQSMRSLENDTNTLTTTKKQLTALEQRREQTEEAISEIVVVIKRGTDTMISDAKNLRSPQITPVNSSPRLRCGTDDATSLTNKRLVNQPRTRSQTEDIKTAITPRKENPEHNMLVSHGSNSAPNLRRLSLSFIRVHDLDINIDVSGSEHHSMNSNSDSLDSQIDTRAMFFLDNDIKSVLDALIQLGYDIVTDESERFTPVLNTAALLAKSRRPVVSSWPLDSWQSVSGSDTFVWTGSIHHNGPGHNLPVVKARGNIAATPRDVMDLMMDSSRVKEYNKMAQSRKDVVILQKGIDTTREESDFDLAGEAKIIQSLNKPPMIRRSIEMLSLMHARKLDKYIGGNPVHGYIAVSRSVWEDAAGTPVNSKDSVRCEMLLGVNLLRAIPGTRHGEIHCELTTISHVHTTAVPQILAQKMAPQHAVNYIGAIRALF